MATNITSINPPSGGVRLKKAIVSAAITAFFGALCFVSMGTPSSAHADTWLDEWHDQDGSHIEIWEDDNGYLYVWGVEADGENWVYTFNENPNPDDPSSNDSPLTPEVIKELLKKYGHEMNAEEEDFWGSFLGHYLSDKGDGIVPVHNPSDLANEYDDGAGGGVGGGFDGNGGDFVEQMKRNGGGTPDGGDDEDRDDYGTEAPKDGMYDDVMVGPPELINPNPVAVDEKAQEAIGR